MAAKHAGLLHSRDDPGVRCRAPQRGRRGVHRLPRPSRCREPGDRRRGRARQRGRDARRTTGRVPGYAADLRGRRQRVAAVHAPQIPCRRDRPTARTALHIPRPPLPERRRHSRPQPHDGEQPPRVLRLRPPRGQDRCRESESMSTVITDLEGVVEDAAAHLYVWALKDIPQDLRDALADAATRETSVPGQRVLQTILKNVNVAETEKNLVCQDTGIAVYTCRVGEHFPLHPGRIYAALKTGTERATVEHPLRSNAVHTITRENTGPNTGYRLPIVHWEF